MFWPKTNKEKSVIFDQKHELTPLEKMILGTLKNFVLIVKKNIVFYLKLYLALFLVLFWPTRNKEKNCIFWPKAPLEKYNFWDFEKFCLYSKKKVCFLSRTLLNLISTLILTENKTWKKTRIFRPNASPNPVGKMRFLVNCPQKFFLSLQSY